jgi:phosphopantothenoylcysteine decarboxylase
MKILLGVCGSISAYKAPSIANAIRNLGHDVKIITTDAAGNFITTMAFAGQGHTVYVDKDELSYTGALHVDLANDADVFLIAPLSANTLAKMANGFCDNLLTSTFKVFSGTDKKIVIAPAMNTKMYLNKITQNQLVFLKETFNLDIVEPVSKTLACGEVGIGGLAEIKSIIDKLII